MTETKIELKPIGFIRNVGKKEKDRFGSWKKVVSELAINKEYQEALKGLEDYSHLLVVFWLDKVKGCELRHVPQGKVGKAPEVGIFACRCPQRPNPVGLSTVKILNIKDNLLKVEGLDALDGTPIIDIKPYTPQYDAVSEAKVPDWVNKLDY